jgi:hypothetical protein
MIVVLAGGNNVVITACFGLPQSDLALWESR